MGKAPWNGQIYRAVKAIDHIGESKDVAKQVQGWLLGEAVEGIYSFRTFTIGWFHPLPVMNLTFPPVKLLCWVITLKEPTSGRIRLTNLAILTSDQLRDPARYESILAAIGGGPHTWDVG
jgi:hypothetical protein